MMPSRQRIAGREEYDIVCVGPDGDVATYGVLTDLEFAERVCTYAQRQCRDGQWVELRRRVVPPAPPPWETLVVYPGLPARMPAER